MYQNKKLKSSPSLQRQSKTEYIDLIDFDKSLLPPFFQPLRNCLK